MAGLPPEASYEDKSIVLPGQENAEDAMAYLASSEAEEFEIIEGGRRRAWEDDEQEGPEHHDSDSSSSNAYDDAVLGAGGEGESIKIVTGLHVKQKKMVP